MTCHPADLRALFIRAAQAKSDPREGVEWTLMDAAPKGGLSQWLAAVDYLNALTPGGNAQAWSTARGRTRAEVKRLLLAAARALATDDEARP